MSWFVRVTRHVDQEWQGWGNWSSGAPKDEDWRGYIAHAVLRVKIPVFAVDPVLALRGAYVNCDHVFQYF